MNEISFLNLKRKWYMKNNKKINFLIENGVSKNTISKMNENQINLMVERFKNLKKQENNEQEVIQKTVFDSTKPDQKEKLNQLLKDPTKLQGQNIEVKEDEQDSVTSSNVFSKDVSQSFTGQEAPHDETGMQDDGMGDDSGENRSMMGMAESEINEKFESKAQQGLFWARCNKCSSKNCKWCKMAKEFSDSTSKKQYKTMPKKKQPEKTVKKKNKKTNEETQKYLENQILKMLEEEKRKQMKKKKSENMILKNPKKVKMFSDEAPMQLPLGKMFSIGFK